jgi:DNA-binding CsgD family transcriptional regulator
MRLTPREMQIAELVAQGLTYREVANSLGLSKKTVQASMRVILIFFNIHSRKELAKRLVDLNIASRTEADSSKWRPNCILKVPNTNDELSRDVSNGS